jgi:hypothetical protein
MRTLTAEENQAFGQFYKEVRDQGIQPRGNTIRTILNHFINSSEPVTVAAIYLALPKLTGLEWGQAESAIGSNTPALVVEQWFKNGRCPKGLLNAQGRLDQDMVNRLDAILDAKFARVYSEQNLTAAAAILQKQLSEVNTSTLKDPSQAEHAGSGDEGHAMLLVNNLAAKTIKSAPSEFTKPFLKKIQSMVDAGEKASAIYRWAIDTVTDFSAEAAIKQLLQNPPGMTHSLREENRKIIQNLVDWGRKKGFKPAAIAQEVDEIVQKMMRPLGNHSGTL